jgi:hypothetical protein
MNDTELLGILKQPDFKFDSQRCRGENISLQTAKFLRWVLLEGPLTNHQINSTFGMGQAYIPLRAGYVTNPLGVHGIEETNLWVLTSDGIALLKRLTE